MFKWVHVGNVGTGPVTVLLCELREVARLCQRINDQSWYALLDRHLGYARERVVQCTSYERGKAGVDTWACRHRERIKREVDEWALAHPPHRAISGTKWGRPGQE